MTKALENLVIAAMFVLALAVTTLAYVVASIATTSSLSCGTARANFLQRANREKLAIGIWNKSGYSQIGVVWRGLASDDEAAAAACGAR